jgi:hypothetical protein
MKREEWVDRIRHAGDYREFVGPRDEYDLSGAIQFNLLTYLGLREYHTLLDVGCGSLRGGRLFVVYLDRARYFAIEPEAWLVRMAIEKEIGEDLIRLKAPRFFHNQDFSLEDAAQGVDFILAQGVFTHAAEWQIQKCFSAMQPIMKPDTLFVASYFKGLESYAGKEWRYPETTTYTAERFAGMARDVGFALVPVAWPHPRGADWVILCHPDAHQSALSLARQSPYRRADAPVTRLTHIAKRFFSASR